VSARQFWTSRLGSLLAVVPLGVWTVNHLWDQLAAFRGADAWQRSVTEYQNPFTQAVTITIVLLPLFIHAVWGIRRLFTTRPNNGAYRTYGNLKYLLQRVSAVGVLGFLGAHMWLAWLHPRLVVGRAEPFAEIAREMHWHMPTLVVYVLGTLGVAYHLANVLWSFSMGWGLAVGKRSLKRMDTFALITFLVLLGMSWAAIYALWSAGGTMSPAEAP
jgi:succinate dehydrogenase / fumarate reductase cytochrome b subunit